MSWRWGKIGVAGACLVIGLQAGRARAADKDDADLKALIQAQQQQIQQLKAQMDALNAKQAAQPRAGAAAPAGGAALTDDSVKKLIADYLKDHPGAGMPPSVQTAYDPAAGFYLRSAPAPSYVPWTDESKIPFELRFRGRLQLDYYGYQPTDNRNHLTGATYHPSAGTESELMVKRLRLIWEGTAFSPDLRYHFEIDGNNRGAVPGFQNNRIVETSGNPPEGSGAAPGVGTATSPIGGGVTNDDAVRLFSAYIAYDMHPCNSQRGCGSDCPEGTYTYSPTVTLIAGKIKPFFAFEEYEGSGNQQMVEYSMTEWMFDADADNLLFAAGGMVKALDDRLFAVALVTNGAENQYPTTQMDDLPGVNLGFWYDFGGTWNEKAHRWDLYGDTPSDIDYSCHPVVRVGASSYLVWMGPRTLYGDEEMSFYRIAPAGPGGSTWINQFSGDGMGSAHSLNSMDAYTFESFWAAKYKGFSILNDWFARDFTNFKTPAGGGDIVEYTGTGAYAGKGEPLNRKSIIDFGTMVQAGYFVVPHKAEVVARWSLIEGESGDIAGLGMTTPSTAFTHYHAAYEYALGFNYFWKRELLKWQTDVSYYTGAGNPAANGAGAAGFLPGVNGWMLRSQIQLAF